MKRLLVRAILHDHPLVKVIRVRMSSHCCFHTLQGHGRKVNSAQFNRAGDRIVIASYDGTVKIWAVGSLISATNWLGRECTLEHALLLHCIYQARIVGLGLRERQKGEHWFQGLRKLFFKKPRFVFDFNTFPHLQQHFETMPPVIQKCLARILHD